MAPISRENIRLIGQLSTVGLSFVFALVIGFAGGNFLDNRLGTRPWLSLLGFVLGLAAGVLNVYRIMKMAGATKAAPRDDGDKHAGESAPPR